MSQETHITAVMYPTPGKVDRVHELLKDMCSTVHSKEDYTFRYLTTEQLDKETPDIIIWETYKDKASAEKHTSESWFKELFGTFDKEGLFAKPPNIWFSKSTSGFDLDHKLL